MRKNKGITLISLIIAIIILLILIGVVINLAIGDNGIFKVAKQAKEETLIAQYKEQIDIIKVETRLKYYDGLTLEKLKNAFDTYVDGNWIKPTQIITDNGQDKIKLITNDGYIFYITNEMTEYKGKNKEETNPDVEMPETPKIPAAEEISFTPEDVNWQVNNVKEALDYLYDN